MPDFIDWPQPLSSPAPRRRRRVMFVIAVVVAALLLSKTFLSYWVDLLWFNSLGYGDIFWRTRGLQWGVFTAFTLATFVILFGTFSALRRAHRAEMPRAHTIVIGGQPVSLSVDPVLRAIALGGSVVVALGTGAAMASDWATLALFWYAPRNAPGDASVLDPIFGMPLSFYLFSLPACQMIVGWLLSLSIITCILAAVFVVITGGVRILNGQFSSAAPFSWRGLSITGAFLLAIVAARVYLGRFERLFAHHTIFDGVTYTDAHVTLPGLLIVSAAFLLGALIAGSSAIWAPRGRWLVVALVPAVVCFVAISLVGWYVSSFLVKPNELVREQPYIVHNIEMTRVAYGLDHFALHEFPAETTVEATDPANNQLTLRNIRLWDVQALQDTLRQIQEIRTYYDFPGIDIDRYRVDGTVRQVMLATRELNVDKLPESSRNWINERLIYTHGYGITMNPVNGFTAEGLPTLMLSNMPVQSTVAGLSVSRPEIYFGEITNADVYVKTRQREFNYPQGQSNSLTSYEGTGGIELGGLLRRILIAYDRGDLTKLPFSDDVNSQSRLLMRRNVRERVSALAPFLTFEQDPYIVVGEDGHLSWMMDAFTVSDRYPYSSHFTLQDAEINYLRNSVKVVVDAYDGSTTFYAFDLTDPILAAYQRIYPGLFKDARRMPAGLRQHVRYPESLLKTQAEMYGLYHMTNPEVFYNREDLWTVASETGTGAHGEQATVSMQPNFVLMKLPGEVEEEFIDILPFTPANRNNLIGWIAGRSDGAHYGSAVVYDFPKTRLVDGPQQIEARIDQNAQLSGQLTLWNQQGSHVRRGSLLVIPSGRALLYAEPIYLQAERSPMPELRLVVLALQDRLAYGPTFEVALNSLFGNGSSSLSASETNRAPAEPSGTTHTAAAATNGAVSPNQAASRGGADNRSLIAAAGKDFSDYQRLTSEGKLGEAGQKLDMLKHVIEQLNAAKR